MVIATILAGGRGVRMNSDTPKQFLKINDKPIIIYTLEKFERNNNIDAIQIVCLESYIEDVKKYVQLHKISKLKWITVGGKTAQESTMNGIKALKDICSAEDIILFHMSVSPLIDDDIINDAINVCNQHGIAIAASQSIFNLCETDNWEDSTIYYPKKNLVTLNMPWTIKFNKALKVYEDGYLKGIGIKEEDYLVSLLIDMGEKLYFSKDSQKNKLKLTTKDDVDLLEGYLKLIKSK